MDRRLVVETTLRERFTPTHLTIADESDRHAGHPGASGGSHFRVLIVSEAFRGKSRVAERHVSISRRGAPERYAERSWRSDPRPPGGPGPARSGPSSRVRGRPL